MPDTARPWPCYPTAHLGDKELARCSLAAEGLLWRMCSMSATGEPFGYLTDSDGDPYTVDDLIESKAASILRGKETVDTLKAALQELMAEERVGFENNCYYVPKMVRIGEARAKAAEDGRLGGNPALTGAKTPPETHRTGPRTALTPLPTTHTPPERSEGQEPGIDPPLRFSLSDCRKAAAGVGVPDSQVVAFFSHYAPVNFVDAAGRDIVSLKHAIAKWKAREHEHQQAEQAETDQGVLDYARHYRRLLSEQDTAGIGALRRKSLDNYGKGGWDRVTKAAKGMK